MSSNGEQRNGQTVAVTENGVTEKTVPMFEGIHLVFRYSKRFSVALCHVTCTADMTAYNCHTLIIALCT
jgi:hypothetical protein